MKFHLFVPAVVVILVLSSFLAAPARALGAYGHIGPMGVVGQDHDADGLIDVVLLSVPIRAEWAGVVTLEVWLPGALEPLAMPLTVPYGTTLVHPAFSGTAFRDLGMDGPYLLNVDLFDPVTGYVMDAKGLTTPAWTAADFDPAEATVAALASPWFLTSESGGLVGTMQLNYTLDVVDPGPYRLWTRVLDETGSLLVSSWDRRTLAAGTVSGAVQVDVSPLTTRGTDGPLNVTFSVVAVYGSVSVVVDSRSVPAPALAPSGLDSLWAYLLPDVASDAFDEDSDGLYDLFVLHAPVHLDRPATVTVASDLLNEPDQEAAPYATSLPAALPAGDSVVDLRFSGGFMNWSYVDGPFWGNLSLTVAELPGYVDTMPFTTVPYHWWAMAPPSATLDETAWPAPEDTDSDGLAEWMSVGVEITVAQEGDYFLQASLDASSAMTYASKAQYLHLAPGTTDVTVRISGIAASRMIPSSLDCDLYRLVSPDEPVPMFGNGWGPATDPSVFEGRDLAYLNGTVTAASGIVPDALVTAVRPADAFSVSVRANATGDYALPLYNGTFTVLVENLEDGASAAVNVTVDGDGLRNFVLPALSRTTAYDAAMTAWNAASVDVTYGFGSGSAAARVYADLYGNFDGVANATELGFYARYPTGPALPGTWPHATPLLPAGGLSVRADGVELVPAANEVASVSGAGPIDATAPVSVILTSDLQGPAPAAASTHVVSAAMPSQAATATTTLGLTLPPGVVWSEANHTSGAAVHRDTPTHWTVITQNTSNPQATTASAWIQTWDHDIVPPAAIASGPSLLERAEPATFDSSNSTDNLGITNTTWTVRANGTTVHGYAETFTWTPTQIGTFDVGVRVRDADGLWDEDNLTVHVADTTAPAAPTGLTATPVQEGGGTMVNLTWSSVAADDLKAYRVYRSSDGTTFTFLGWSDGTAAAFADASVSSGGTFRYRVTAVDRYSNEGSPSVTAQAVVPGPGGNAGPLDLGLVAGIAAVVVGVAVVATVLILRRRKGSKPPTEPGQ